LEEARRGVAQKPRLRFSQKFSPKR
jgi:hypothetical protein